MLCVAVWPVAVRAEGVAFINQINVLWKAKNYQQILQQSTAESVKQPPLPESFAVLFGYHLFISGNHQQAVQSLNQLAAHFATGDPKTFQAVSEFKNEFLQVPGDQMQPLTVEAMQELHRIFPDEFPVKSLLISIAKRD